jgi:hypothetical protein
VGHRGPVHKGLGAKNPCYNLTWARKEGNNTGLHDGKWTKGTEDSTLEILYSVRMEKFVVTGKE